MEATVTLTLTEFDDMRRKIKNLTDEVAYLHGELDKWKQYRPDLFRYVRPDKPGEIGERS